MLSDKLPDSSTTTAHGETIRLPPEVPMATTSAAVEYIMSSFDSKHAVTTAQAPDSVHPSPPPPAALSSNINPTDTDIDTDTSPSPNPNPTPDATPDTPRSNLRLTFILMALFLSLFVAALDATIVATAVPVMAHELGSATGYTWIGGAYLLANAAGAPIWAKLSDIWGRKPVMLAALALFFAASAVCASAREMTVLIAGRALQGVAGGGLILLVHVVISDLFSVRRRSLIMGVTEAVWATAGGLGPPLGGIFASLVSWRWCFYLNLPVCGLAAGLIAVFLDVKHEQTGLRTGLRAMDWWGMFSFLAFVLLVLLGLDFGGDVFPWDSAKVVALLAVGTAMLALFVWSEARLARYPLVPLALFRDTSNLASVGVGFFHGLAFMPGEYYLPLYLQAVQQASPVRSGVLLVPLVVATAAVGIVTGVIIHRTARFRELIWLGTSLLCLANGLFITLDASTPLARVLGLTVLFGCGSGMLFEPPLIAIQSRAAQRDVATATSTFSFCRSVALAVSVIVGGVVFQNGMDTQVSRLRHLQATNTNTTSTPDNDTVRLPPAVLDKLSGKSAAANVALAGTLPDPAQRALVRDAFARAMRNMWYVYVALAALGVVCAVFVRGAPLSRDHVETVTGIKREKEQQQQQQQQQEGGARRGRVEVEMV